METRRRTSQRWQLLDKRTIPLAEIAEHYLSTCRVEGKTASTLRGYREKLSRFVRWFDGPLGDFSIETIRDYIATLQGARKWDGHPFSPQTDALVSPQTVVNHVRVLKAFATWLYEEQYTDTNHLARLSLPKAPRKLIEVLSQEEVARLLHACESDGALGCRDLCIVMLLLDTGLRRSEIVSLRVGDVHLDDQWLMVKGKGQKERQVPFGGRVATLLRRYIRQDRDNPLGRDELFLTIEGEPVSLNTVSMLFTRLRRRSSIARLHPHLLRHTFATYYLVAGGDVFTLQNILGHTTLEMTRRYVALASSHVNIQHRRFSPIDRLDSAVVGHRRSARRIERPARPRTVVPAATWPLTGKPRAIGRIRT
jgi:integrase/recombinase XerC/integrase/recombinase XerD